MMERIAAIVDNFNRLAELAILLDYATRTTRNVGKTPSRQILDIYERKRDRNTTYTLRDCLARYVCIVDGEAKNVLTITPTLELDESKLVETFVRASGPGGQNVNKVATAVQLRFDIPHSSLPEAVRERLLQLAANRISADGVLTIDARRFRTQEQNRADARERLIELLRRASAKPKTRRATKPSRAAKAQRLENKKRHSQVKQARRATSQLES